MTGQPTVIHPDFPNNLAVRWCPAAPASARTAKSVDDTAVDKAFADAEVVISQRMMNHRLVPNAMEPRGVVAHYEPGKDTADHLVVDAEPAHPARRWSRACTAWASTRCGRSRRRSAAGSAPRSTSTPRNTSLAGISKQLGMPLKWIEDRSEAFVATTHGRDIIGYLDIAAKRDGTLLGLKMRLIADIGAYNMLLTAAIPTLTMLMANATYTIPAVRVTLTEVFTNKTPTDAYRGAGRPEATYFVERAHGHAGARAEDGSRRSCGGRTSSRRTPFPYHDADGRGLRLGRLREGARRWALKASDWEGLKKDARRGQGRRTARRPRAVDVRRGLRHRAVGVAPDRRLGARAGHDRARRPHHRDHRRLTARAGQRDDVRADARRPVRRAAGARHDPARRHRAS